VSIDTLRGILKDAGLVWKRIRKSVKFKRDKEAFEQARIEIEDLQEKADDGILDLYYFDGAGFSLDPTIPYAWQPKGEVIEVPAAHSKRVNVLGFMNTDNKLESFVFECRIDTSLVIDCFNLFCQRITKKTVVVIDNAPIQTSDEFVEWIEEWRKQGLIIKYLPEYCPELNLIEILWRMIKYQWLPFSAYSSFQSLQQGVIDILGSVGSKYQIVFS
jgi:transposase